MTYAQQYVLGNDARPAYPAATVTFPYSKAQSFENMSLCQIV